MAIKFEGKILWWSDRDENGIIIDGQGNEFYFDRSTVNFRPSENPARDQLVLFSKRTDVQGVNCARDVSLVARSFSGLKYSILDQDRVSALIREHKAFRRIPLKVFAMEFPQHFPMFKALIDRHRKTIDSKE